MATDSTQATIGGAGEQPQPVGASVTLVRGGHSWRFACTPGDEALLLRAAEEVAAREGSPLDGFDVAVIAQQLVSDMREGLKDLVGRQPGG
jgi:hypothetical protein